MDYKKVTNADLQKPIKKSKRLKALLKNHVEIKRNPNAKTIHEIICEQYVSEGGRL